MIAAMVFWGALGVAPSMPPPDLIVPDPGRAIPSGPLADRAVRIRPVALRGAALQKLLESEFRPGLSLGLALFEDRKVIVILEKIMKTGPDRYVLMGHASSSSGSRVTFAFSKSAFYASVSLPGQGRYQVRTDPGGALWVVELAPALQSVCTTPGKESTR